MKRPWSVCSKSWGIVQTSVDEDYCTVCFSIDPMGRSISVHDTVYIYIYIYIYTMEQKWRVTCVMRPMLEAERNVRLQNIPMYWSWPCTDLVMYRNWPAYVPKSIMYRMCPHVPKWTTVQKLCTEIVCTENVLYRYGSTPIRSGVVITVDDCIH